MEPMVFGRQKNVWRMLLRVISMKEEHSDKVFYIQFPHPPYLYIPGHEISRDMTMIVGTTV
jgi:hypothetical protein